MRPEGVDWAFVGEIPFRMGAPDPVLTHLGCFYPGNVALGVISQAVVGDKAGRYLWFAESMMHACYQLYNLTTSGLGADNARVDMADGTIQITSSSYLQRPEVVESLFYLWRATHNRKYRDWGWAIFQSIEKHCRKEAGYSGVESVIADPLVSDDVQQSWFLAETLKYLFLLFSDDDVLPLDKWVFNTEAHPVRVAVDDTPDWLDWEWLLGKKEVAIEDEYGRIGGIGRKGGAGVRVVPNSEYSNVYIDGIARTKR